MPGLALMIVLGLVLVGGVVLTARWGGVPYRPWPAAADAGPAGRPTVPEAARRYGRGVAVALVAGFWTGLLVTGPAIRLIMRLLAVTAGDDAQGAITEAEEVVGEINLGGTLGLIVFGGVLSGLLSGGIYVLVRRWLPAGRLGGLTFGALHLVVAATRVDPLRPENPDFDIVGPSWLSLATFGLACLLHGMAVAALANRYSHAFPPSTADRRRRIRSVVPLVPPALLLIPGVAVLGVLIVGGIVVVAGSQVRAVVAALRSRAALVVGRVALAAVALALLPGAVDDLVDVAVREEAGAPAADAQAAR